MALTNNANFAEVLTSTNIAGAIKIASATAAKMGTVNFKEVLNTTSLGAISVADAAVWLMVPHIQPTLGGGNAAPLGPQRWPI